MSSVKEFWMVHGLGKGAPAVQHATRKEARAEAQRLAKGHPGTTFVTLRVEDAYMAPVAVVPVAVERKESAPEVKPQTEDDDWIKWDGGDCPVDPDTTVFVQFRSEDQARGDANKARFRAGGLRWTHTNSNADIIAYKVVTA